MSIIDDISLDLHDARDSLVVSELALELGWESQERGPDTRAVRASWPPASNFVLELASDSRHMARARVQADELAGGTTSIETLGARAARAALQRVVGDVVAAARTHRVPKKLTPRVISALQPIVRDAILVAMLRGRDRARQLAKRKATNVLSLAVTSPYGQVLGVLAKQFDARVVKRLAKLADARALEVSTGLGKLVDQRVRDTLRELIAVGSTTGDAVKTLAQTMNGLGVTPSSPHALETMFRTQAQVAYGAGRWIADQDPDIQEILWGYTYVTVGDDRVREEHAALDGVTLPKDDPFWQRFFPPNGWNCRCQAIPVFDATGYREAPSETASGKLVLPDDGFDQNFGELLRADVGEDVIGLSQSLGTLVFGWEDQPRGADGKFGAGTAVRDTRRGAWKATVIGQGSKPGTTQVRFEEGSVRDVPDKYLVKTGNSASVKIPNESVATRFHGTTIQVVNEIKRNGIRAQDGELGVAAYTTDSYAEAMEYGVASTEAQLGRKVRAGDKLAIVEIKQTKSERLVESPSFAVESSGRATKWGLYTDGVSPKQVLGVKTYDAYAVKQALKGHSGLPTREEISALELSINDGGVFTFVIIDDSGV